MAVYTRRKNQSQEGRRYIPGVKTNRRRGGGIYPARGGGIYPALEPVAGGEAEGRWYIPGVRTSRRRGGGVYLHALREPALPFSRGGGLRLVDADVRRV
eukprot:1196097-Prorocentrum_minimum.AAC.4